MADEFSADRVNVVAGPYQISGISEDVFVQAEFNEPRYSMSRSGDGKANAHVKNASRDGMIRITVKRTSSKVLRNLTNLAATDEQFEFYCKDLDNGDVVKADNCRFVNTPSLEKNAGNVGDVTWEIQALELDIKHGSLT